MANIVGCRSGENLYIYIVFSSSCNEQMLHMCIVRTYHMNASHEFPNVTYAYS